MNSLPSQYIPDDKVLVGTCSQCGGPVCVHKTWICVVPDVPCCLWCGASAKVPNNFGPVIPMNPSHPKWIKKYNLEGTPDPEPYYCKKCSTGSPSGCPCCTGNCGYC